MPPHSGGSFPYTTSRSGTVPAVIVLLLIRQRSQISETDYKIRYGFLIAGYRFERFYWEYIVIYRKLLIIVHSVFLTNIPVSPGSILSRGLPGQYYSAEPLAALLPASPQLPRTQFFASSYPLQWSILQQRKYWSSRPNTHIDYNFPSQSYLHSLVFVKNRLYLPEEGEAGSEEARAGSVAHWK